MSINIQIRLRPIRFGFLVKPDDSKNLTKIFEINTCLWGGQFNPIIPYFSRVPSWWERINFKFDNAKQIINGYLDFFEPDFLVEAEPGLSEKLGFDSDRVLQLHEILKYDEQKLRRFGLTLNDLYRHLYNKEFQFQKRYKQNFIQIKADKKELSSFTACIFGNFPRQDLLDYFEENYQYVFEPSILVLNGSTLNEVYRSNYISPLMIGNQELEINYNENQPPTLFILDISKSRDLIDFWNLRAIHKDMLAIPLQYIEELSSFCKEYILKHHRPLPGNHNGVMIHPTCMFSRSIPEGDIEQIHKQYLLVESGSNTIQTWYPPIWRDQPNYTVRKTRPILNSKTISLISAIENNNSKIRFDSIYPDFSIHLNGSYGIANVVKLRDDTNQNQIATVFPCNYKNSFFLKLGFSTDSYLSTTEGVVFFPEFQNVTESWDLVDCTTAVNTWFNQNNIKAAVSDAGRATQQIIQTLGGFTGVSSIAHREIVKLLNKISQKPITRSAQYQKFQNAVYKAIKNTSQKENVFKRLIEKKAVELGLEVKCDNCGNWSWYYVNQLDYELTCDLCLKKYPFPITCPSKNKWSYRVIGPFALPDYSRGGYSASLAIRFFANLGLRSSNLTWSAGQELSLPSREKVEADFILWYQRQTHVGPNYQTEIIFGEAKSFGKEIFEQDDIDKMKLLAETFPGSILVFATMKKPEDLSSKEIIKLRKLSEWGRSYNKERKQSRAPVIILTGTELFAGYSIQQSWIEKGGNFKKLAESYSPYIQNLRILADLTQQLYLSMESYNKWLEDKWKKK
ncbi:hypothetical protein BN59_01598 [Legionella massiliensis]|uniref:Uncharacterized protein n=1 Tax=Legionella massiliensis TaxID=1034943 RepID=A0A078KS71_9GAMM|nr:hypothetical protein [Legionella massiliensis]CDZ77315.1 hypothetical protein BN59_01598 [Legionella massiliensis]CEE13053.1 hypothetical protein BN1094_01598 [Legionella massiliensis]